ncbi:MAG TPA: efflux RND transporter periplasmic adaptor subunit [Bryobacteraceae bacterium]|nr:efflux RND transporter periplasmic adaptor subunit [Bryobacteraceae bacterium]
MKRIIARAGFIVIGLALGMYLVHYLPYQEHASASEKQHLADSRPSLDPVSLACPGRIEGESDTIHVGAAIDGVIRTIRVKEGEKVVKGQVLAELECADLKSALQIAQAEADSLQQSRARLLRGSRVEEREAAAQNTAAAKAVVEQTAAQRQRMLTLRMADEVSKSSYDQVQRDYEVAQAQYQRAVRNQQLVNAGPLSEEVARADADLRAAKDKVQLAQNKLDKCFVRAPIDGTILRVQLHEGESFALVAPRPLFSIANLSGRRVVAEVDERDVGAVQVGQKVNISADAYSRKQFSGTVTRIVPVMGKKSVLTGDPADKSDRDVLEVVAGLEKSALELPVGLRVTVQFWK